MEITVGLAGLSIGICAPYPEIKVQCAPYLCSTTPDFSVAVTPEDLAAEERYAAREAVCEGHPPHHFTQAELQSTAVYRKTGERLPAYGALVFHGSAVAVDGVCYLFTAKSGTGKSTHTALWRQQFGSRAVMINDDKPILRITGDGVFVCGTPWDGKHHLSTNTIVPLAGLAVLERGQENHIEPVPAHQVWPMLLQQSYRPADPAALRQTMDLLDQLAAAVPLYRLTCNMDLQAAQVAFDTMQPNRKDISHETER